MKELERRQVRNSVLYACAHDELYLMSPPHPPLSFYDQNEMEKHLSQKRAEKQQITEQQAEEARLQLEEKLERCGWLKSSAHTRAHTHMHAPQPRTHSHTHARARTCSRIHAHARVRTHILTRIRIGTEN